MMRKGSRCVSSIFTWFREDFEQGGGTLLDFVLRYLPAAQAAEVREGPPPRIEFLDYDWSLNGA